jgi:hypothetical protein
VLLHSPIWKRLSLTGKDMRLSLASIKKETGLTCNRRN